MAKDGTRRGGARAGAGRKPKALTDKINEGISATIIELPETPTMEGVDVPPVKDYLKTKQKNGKDLCAAEVFEETWKWLKARECERLVNNQLVEQYAMSVSRWIQCEECISEYGFLAKHPTTGNAIASPYVAMSQQYMKQVNQVWYTIQRIFPSLDTKDYLEIGRMCMTEEMPRNSESQMLSQLVKWIRKNIPELKILFTWADGMVGKVGYVYQASNFIYAGYSDGEMYMKDGVKIHVRQMKSFLVPDGQKDDRITVRPTAEQMKKYNILHFKGKQYRYLMFLCGKQEKKRLLKECLIDLGLSRPKDDDLSWRVKDTTTGKWVDSEKPPYVTDVDRKTKGLVVLNEEMKF